ncbi:hypothetical protein, partial [Streptomyces boluensis]
MRTTIYRVLGPGWGIAIDLTAAAHFTSTPPAGEQLAGRVHLDVTPVLAHPPADRTGLRLSAGEAAWLRGLERPRPAFPVEERARLLHDRG